jgi:hypothetical protein
MGNPVRRYLMQTNKIVYMSALTIVSAIRAQDIHALDPANAAVYETSLLDRKVTASLLFISSAFLGSFDP